MWFNLDIKKLSVLLLPTFLRSTAHIKWLWALLKPLEDVYYQWTAFRKDNIYRLSHNSQICYLRKVLNDQFDAIQRRIEITDGNRYQRIYIYTTGEQKPRFLGTMYLRPASDYADTGVDFIVLAPAELLDENNFEMKYLIDYYKLASKRYKIERL